MRAIVCGAGRVGYGIAARLAKEKATVTVIDQSAKLIRSVTERLDVRGVVGAASYPETLEEAGAKESDMVIAVTASDEVNIVSCQIAHSLFAVPTKIARIRAKSYLDSRYTDVFSRENIPIDVIISPEAEVAEAVMQRMSTPAAFDIKSFADGAIWAVGVKLGDDCPLLNTPLRQVRELFPDLLITIVGAQRGDHFFRATGDDQLQSGDSIYFVSRRSNVDRAMSILGQEQARARRIVIIGGGSIGFDVASKMEAAGKTKIRMVEADLPRANYIAEHLKKTIVLNGSGLDRDILREAGVGEAESVVALTDSDQTNLLAGLLAKSEGARRANVLINEPEYVSLSEMVGIDRVIDPRAVTISTILQHIRRGRIKSVYSILNGEAELIEAVALETSPLVGVPLADFDLPAGIVIGAILRMQEVILPEADTVVEAHDRVILFALRDDVPAVEKLFRVSVEFF